MEAKLSQWYVPFISGLVKEERIQHRGAAITMTLISRKEKTRDGARFISRGLDKDGNASNSVETEQLVRVAIPFEADHKYSYLQYRGSIPLIWTQRRNLSISKKVSHHHNQLESQQSFKNHLASLRTVYKNVHMVNLVDKGDSGQGRLGQKFQEAFLLEGCSKTNYTWFDFHGECRGNKWENLEKLISLTKDDLAKFEYFKASLELVFVVSR